MEGYDETMPLRLVVDKPDVAKKAIEPLGEPVTMESALSIQTLNDKPGFIAKVARKLADASVNIESIYHTYTSGRGGDATIYISVDKSNLERSMRLMKSL